ncbi:hypothetical protein FRB96_007743 [Tulasnella sp. 330]|nr:hypothetical protein FRB96_007743 [Tulasnella sp. 330]KAG8874253.1 hypothetical protein FRB97_006050 [Tulasnella sp. 331]
MFPHYALYLPLVAALGLLPLTNYAESVASNQGSTSTPPMGWNSWNHFGCNVSESTISDAMDYVVSVQLQDYGYEYIIIDDCWHANARDNITRQPVADPVHFPRGIKYLADRAHNMGLKARDS